MSGKIGKIGIVFAAAAAIAALGTLSGTSRAESVVVDIGSATFGTSSTDTRTPGDYTAWWNPSNAATSAQVVNYGASQALKVWNNGSGNDGTIDNVLSPELNALAGQTGASAQPGATQNAFTSVYDFTTVSSSAVDNFNFISSAEGSDRTTWLGFTSDSNGVLSAGTYDAYNPGPVGGTTSWNYHQIGTGLAWGDTYQVTTTILFGSGANSDQVTTRIYNETTSTLVGTNVGTTWADYFLYDSEQTPNGNVMPGVNSMMFEMRHSPAGPQNGAYVTNLSYSSFSTPIPASGLLAGVGALTLIGGLALRRRMAAKL